MLDELKDVTVPSTRILVSLLKPEEVKTSTGLITSLATKENQFLDGVVQLIGPGRLSSDKETIIPLQVEVGDIIRFDDTQAKRASINGTVFFILLDDSCITAIIGKVVDDKNEIVVDI